MGLFGPSDPALRAQVARLERKIDAIAAHLGITGIVGSAGPSDSLDDDVRELIAAGKTIAAIKLYRERTRASLADAKAAVERGL